MGESKFISIILVLFAVFYQTSYAQESYTIRYNVDGYKGKHAYLLSIRGHEFHQIDSAHVQNGQIKFTVQPSLSTGMYRIAFGDSLFTDVIFNKENVLIENDIRDLAKNLRVISSKENQVYYDYWRVSKLLNDTLNNIAKTGNVIFQANGGKMTRQLDSMRMKALVLNRQLNKFVDTLLLKVPGSFAAKIIRANLTPDYFAYIRKPGAYPYKTQYEFLRDHYFDNVDLSDSLLLNSDIIYISATNYLNYFGDPQTTENYDRATDTIMKRVSVNEAVMGYMLNLLLHTFGNSNWEKVYEHIVDTWVITNSCEIADAKKYADQSDAMKRLTAGNPSPAVVLNDINGKSVSLYDVNAKATLLFFWASDCPHCHKIMPEVVSLYKTYHPKGLEIYAISADNNEKSWKDAVKNNGATWINVSDLKGADSEILVQFHAWSTPAFFLLDAQKKIYSRPLTITQVLENLESLLK